MRKLLAIMLIPVILSAAFAQDAVTCPGALPSRLTPGLVARVLPGDANNVRDLPSRSGGMVGQIPGGATFAVLEGPECADDLTWYKVDYNGMIGWTVEGAGGDYFLEPLEVAVTPTPIPSATPIPTTRNPFLAPDYPVQNVLAVGAAAYTNSSSDDFVQVRSTPGVNGESVARLTAGLPVTITDGPIEADGYRWWQIETAEGVRGWTAEGIAESRNFLPLLVPLCPAEVTAQASILAVIYDTQLFANNVYTANSDGELLCNLSYATNYTEVNYVQAARWSPDGTQIAFIALAPNGFGSAIYLMDADGSSRQVVVSNILIGTLEWSTNGEFISFSGSLPEQESIHLWAVRPDGSAPRVLSEGRAIIAYSHWSPVAERLLYERRDISEEASGQYAIGVVGADLSRPRLFEIEGDHPMAMGWSPDGTKIAVALKSSGELAIFEADSGESTVLTTFQDVTEYSDLVWSPDGQTITVLTYLNNANTKVQQFNAATGALVASVSIPNCGEDIHSYTDDGRVGLSDDGKVLIFGNACAFVVDMAEGSATPVFTQATEYVDFRP